MPTDDSARGGDAALWAALQGGAYSAGAGFLVGGTTGILRSSKTPVLWTIATTIQWALLGGSYWGIRTAILDTQKEEEMSPRRLLLISGASGGLSAALVGALTRGRQNVLPGMVMGSLVGIAGQGVYGDVSRWVQHRRDAPQLTAPMWKRALSSKWSPMKLLTDEEYAEHINRQLLKREVDIALLDEQIKKLKESQSSTEASSQQGAKRKDS